MSSRCGDFFFKALETKYYKDRILCICNLKSIENAMALVEIYNISNKRAKSRPDMPSEVDRREMGRRRTNPVLLYIKSFFLFPARVFLLISSLI